VADTLHHQTNPLCQSAVIQLTLSHPLPDPKLLTGDTTIPNMANPPPSSDDATETQPATEPERAPNDQGAALGDLRELSLVDATSEGIRESSFPAELERISQLDLRRIGFSVLLQIFSKWVKERTIRFNAIENKNTALSSELTDARIELAALKRETAIEQKYWALHTFAMVAGPFTIGLGVDQLKSENWGPATVLLLIGTVSTATAIIASRRHTGS